MIIKEEKDEQSSPTSVYSPMPSLEQYSNYPYMLNNSYLALPNQAQLLYSHSVDDMADISSIDTSYLDRQIKVEPDLQNQTPLASKYLQSLDLKDQNDSISNLMPLMNLNNIEYLISSEPQPCNEITESGNQNNFKQKSHLITSEEIANVTPSQFVTILGGDTEWLSHVLAE